jgi:predicted phosphoribosyltransferase
VSAAPRFHDRREAGKRLAQRLVQYARHADAVVLALPRGGVPVGYEIALELALPLDVFSVRKLGVPGHEELAMGALCSGGEYYLNASLIQALRLSDEELRETVAREQQELERRERLYRDRRPHPEVVGKSVILVDDGLATGATMQAAIVALRRRSPGRLVAAVPVAPADTLEEVAHAADEIVCYFVPLNFNAVGMWYDDFSQTSDDEVRALLTRAAERPFLSREEQP